MGISMENRRMLQFSEPLFKTWSSDNFLISSILSKDTAYDWFMNYYVNTMCVIKDDITNASPSILFHPACIPTTSQFICNVWDLCPFIEKITLNREIVKLEYEKFSDFVIKFISNNYFIYANFEQSKIRKEKYTHKAYITGFNVNSNEIYLSDNVDFGRFTNFSLSFEDINNAFIKADDIIPLYDKDHQMEENSIYLIKVKEFNYKFNINLFIQFLKNFQYVIIHNNYHQCHQKHQTCKMNPALDFTVDRFTPDCFNNEKYQTAAVKCRKRKQIHYTKAR